MTYRSTIRIIEIIVFAFIFSLFSAQVNAVGKSNVHPDKARVVDHWTPDRMRQAIPRDLRLDRQGQAFVRSANGQFVPYGVTRSSPITQGKPSGNGDSEGPDISNLNRVAGADAGVSQEFFADVIDVSGVRSVTVKLQKGTSGSVQSFSAANITQDTWAASLTGFTDGDWYWWVEARDGTKRGGNLSESTPLMFTVNTGGEPPVDPPVDPPAEGVVVNDPWVQEGVVIMATGRIYFEMPANKKRKGPWNGYVCSGTVISDADADPENTSSDDRSVILTAAHCVYDDANKAFARNVLFIPNQAASGTATDSNCNNDVMGCWLPDFGVVDENWSNRVFPDNIPWDYAYYVVNDTGAHDYDASQGFVSDVLDSAAGSLMQSFAPPYVNDGDPGAASIDFTHGLGYSYSDDPNFMYCAEDMTVEGSANWWLASCGLSGGASGGPWIQHLNDEAIDDVVMSVNSWGYTGSPGMAGPKLSGTSAQCLYVMAYGTDWSSISSRSGDQGVVQTCP